MIKTYKDYIVWQKSIQIVKHIYEVTATFPKSELFGLVSQMRRCSVGIPSCIAEGFGRNTLKEHAQFYTMAYGSGLELETQLYIARELGFISESDFQNLNALLEEVLKMLNKMKSVRKY